MDSSSDSSESDDCDGLRRKALEVILPTDFNPDSEPQDGTEYLQHVIYERRKIRKYLRADIDISKYRKNQTFNIHNQKNEVETFMEYLPSIEWQVKKLKDFHDFKMLIDDQIDKNYVPKVGFFSPTQFTETLNTDGPKLTEFLKYTQAVKLGMLEIITKTLNESFNNWSLKDSVGEWIFAILSTLSIPLSPHGCHVIRDFTRMCRKVRSSFPQDVDSKLCEPLNFYICICSKAYGQIDLAD